MQAACDRQKSYADLKRKPMEFQVGDKVMLKVSPWKGVVHFGKRGKLNPRYVGPFKVLERIGDVAYKLVLPEELSRVHNTFHVLSYNESKSRRVFERAFMTLFGQDNETFTSTMFLYLEKYFAKCTRIEVEQFRETLLQHMSNVKKSVAERTRHKRQYDRRMNKRQMQTHASKVDSSKALDADLVVMESNETKSGKQDTSSS
nr:reverse transcriptase domain-containing protein [Tanacetum cinerariifolium]